MDNKYTHILAEKQGYTATITMNRPEVLNAINGLMARELKNAFDRFSDDTQVKVIVLTGAGKAFCVGQDLNEFGDTDPIPIAETLQERYNPLVMSMHNSPKIIIGKINGMAFGAGCSLALACDITVSIESAVYSMAFVNIGLVPDCGASYFLPRLVGRAKAFELMTMGFRFSARDAHQIGMINIMVEHDKVLSRKVLELADRYAHGPSQTLGLIKGLLNKSFGYSLDKMLEKEASFQEKAGKTTDFKEGIQAFREKRPPVFTDN